MDKEQFLDITRKYASGTITPEEEAVLINAIDSSPEYLILFKETVDAWIPPATDPVTDRKWEKIRATIRPSQQQTKQKKMFSLYRYWQIAAAVVVIALGSFSAYLLNSNRNVVESDTWISEVATCQDKVFLLPDSSSVYLRSGSSLSYNMGEGTNLRRVRLQGEAFFDVVKDSSAPFSVETEGLTIRVLGTSFSVDARTDLETISVVLLEGKVSLVNDSQESVGVLIPGQKADFLRGENSCEITEVDSDRLTLWRKGIITYENVTVKEIVNLLMEHFQQDLRIEAVADDEQRYSGAFMKTQSLHTVVEQIEKLTGSQIILMNSE